MIFKDIEGGLEALNAHHLSFSIYFDNGLWVNDEYQANNSMLHYRMFLSTYK